MKQKTIKYIGFYDIPDSVSDRIFAPAAVNKMNYIGDVMKAHNIDYKFDAEHCSVMIMIEHMYELLANITFVPNSVFTGNTQYAEAKSVVDELIK